LGEVGSALTFVLGTPWSENPPDLYKTLKDRSEADPDTTIAVRIDPIMVIKPYARNKPLTHLVEDDIESFLFPERLDWKFIRSEIMKNPKDTTFFESQNLCHFVPPEESKWKVAFDEDELRNLVVFQTRFTGWAPLRSILSVDTASSVNRYANMSCIAFSKLFEDAKDGKRYFAVISVDADKYRPSEIAQHVADAVHKYGPDIVTIERPGLWQALQTLIEQEANRRGFSLTNRIHWREQGTPQQSQKRPESRTWNRSLRISSCYFSRAVGTNSLSSSSCISTALRRAVAPRLRLTIFRTPLRWASRESRWSY
jgi:hypothetical protein